jgi:hypothetical protein
MPHSVSHSVKYPIYDIDGGYFFQGYNPSVLNHTTPKDTYVSVPWRFGGSNIRSYISPSQLATKK